MKIRQIEYFLEVEKTLNITKAAQNMYVTQTAITKQLQLLEEELGFALFSRENKRMRLTEGGIFFKEEALRLMHQYHLTRQNVAAYRYGEAGCINIGFLKTLIPSCFCPACPLSVPDIRKSRSTFTDIPTRRSISGFKTAPSISVLALPCITAGFITIL